MGYERYTAVHAWQGMGNRSVIPADVQVSLPDSTAHVQMFFPPKMQKQMTVTSFDDVTDVLLTFIKGKYKRKLALRPRGSFLVFLFGSFGLFPS